MKSMLRIVRKKKFHNARKCSPMYYITLLNGPIEKHFYIVPWRLLLVVPRAARMQICPIQWNPSVFLSNPGQTSSFSFSLFFYSNQLNANLRVKAASSTPWPQTMDRGDDWKVKMRASYKHNMIWRIITCNGRGSAGGGREEGFYTSDCEGGGTSSLSVFSCFEPFTTTTTSRRLKWEINVMDFQLIMHSAIARRAVRPYDRKYFVLSEILKLLLKIINCLLPLHSNRLKFKKKRQGAFYGPLNW